MYRLSFIMLLLLIIGLSACSKSKKELFTLSCTSPTVCTKTANVYLVNVDGLFVELTPEFVDSCNKQSVENKVTNIYCKQMIFPGHSETFETSADVVRHLQEYGFNPTDADVDRRMQIARQKVYGQQ